jgi:hypothetical protein
MNINRHNYEEFFLLYVDNELTAAERAMVEAFLAANPDLKEELELLQQSTFTVDAKLDDAFKNSLLKPVDEKAAVTEEQLLLFIDNELRVDEAASVLKAAAEDDSLQKELHLLQRSKLTPDTSVIFPHKSLLYKDAQPARVFSMSTAVRRWSAAAAVLLMLGTGVWLVNKNNKTESLVDGSSTPVKVDEQKANNKIEPIVPPVQSNELVQQQPAVENNVSPVGKQKISTIVSVAEQKKNDAVAVQNNQQKQTQQPFVPQPDNQTTVNAATIATTELPQKNNPDNGNNSTTSTVPSIETSIAKTTTSFVSNEDDGDEDEQNGLLNENRQRSTGLKGLLKRAKRTFERRTGVQSGESQVRFAVFAVNTQ